MPVKRKKASSLKKKRPSTKAEKTESGNANFLKGLSKNIWPIERDLFFRPDRFKYVRKVLKTEGCVFCAANKGGLSFDSLCVYKNKSAMVVLNKFPYNSGHLLVLPQRHCGDFLGLSQGEYSDVMSALKLSVEVVQEVYQCQGFNIGLNHGAVAGAGIPEHLHWHLVPRWSGDMNFFPLIAETKTVIETLEQTYDKVSEAFKLRGSRS